MLHEIAATREAMRPKFFSFGLIPWVVRTKVYGSHVTSYGPKANNTVFLSHSKDVSFLESSVLRPLTENFFQTGKSHFVDNMLSLTLSVDNQIIHPARVYDLATRHSQGWKNRESVPFFYRDWSFEATDTLISLDNDYEKIRTALRKEFPDESFIHMSSYLELERFSYAKATPDVQKSFSESTTLSSIVTPISKVHGRFFLDRTHRFFLDDFSFGLEIAQWFGRQLGVKTKNIDGVLDFGTDYSATERMFNSKKDSGPTPSSYGLKTLSDVVLCGRSSH